MIDFPSVQVLEQAPYRVILADPPWPHSLRRTEKRGTPSSFSNAMSTRVNANERYDCHSYYDIAAMDVASIAADQSVLFLWAQWAILEEAIGIVRAWGFKFRSGFPWVKMNNNGIESKLQHVPGYWWMNCTEPVLMGTRGKTKREWRGYPGKYGILIQPRPRRHSTKPETLQTWIDRWYSEEMPKIELFSRKERTNWVSWGDEI